MKALLHANGQELIPGAGEKQVRRNFAGRALAVMTVTAIVAGATWFLSQSGKSGDDVGLPDLAAGTGSPKKQSASVTVETSALEVSGKVSKPVK